jgi:PAS domain S-box-containing protein
MISGKKEEGTPGLGAFDDLESILPLDFLSKIEIALGSILIYEGCIQAALALVEGKQRRILCTVSLDKVRLKLKGLELPKGNGFQEIPLHFPFLNRAVVLQLHGANQVLDRKAIKRIQGIFSGLEQGFYTVDQSIHFQRSPSLRQQHSDEKYLNLLQNMLHAVVYHDSAGKITYANPAAERILGLTQDQLYGKTSMDPDWRAIHENGSDFLGQDHPSMQALRTGKPVKNVVMGIQPGKAKRVTWILINAIPESNVGAAEVSQVLVTFSDITQLREIRKTIEEKAGMLRSIIESSTESIWAVNTDFLLRYSNSKFVKFCKIVVGETIGIGDDVLDFIPQEKREAWKRNYQKAFGGEFLEFSDSYVTKHGVQHYRVNINPVISANKVIGATVFAKNVTDLEQFMQTISRQNERFKEISWLQSHVIRAPLARLMGIMELLLEDSSMFHPDMAQYLEKLKGASLELDRVIRDISHKSEDLL